MKLNYTKLVPAGALLCLMFASCKKNDAVKTTSQLDDNVAKTTSMIGAMASETDLDFSNSMSNELNKTDCAVITYSPSENVYPHTKVIDYGSGCTDEYGVTRSGKVMTTVYADRETAAAGIRLNVVTFSDYYVDGVKIEGSESTSVIDPASSGALTVKVINSRVISDNSGNSTSYISTATRKRIAGNGTTTATDDVFQLMVTAYGTAITGGSTMSAWKYTTDASNPVVFENTCPFRTQGGLQITINDNGAKTAQYLDYGNGSCDNSATLSTNGGAPQPVSLPFHFFGVDL
ncbi:MAG: hypothetical protein JST21_09885 [Bacteroidetes bacterium]|nr:hypothetical protein [Bacteroidota bacterium]